MQNASSAECRGREEPIRRVTTGATCVTKRVPSPAAALFYWAISKVAAEDKATLPNDTEDLRAAACKRQTGDEVSKFS